MPKTETVTLPKFTKKQRQCAIQMLQKSQALLAKGKGSHYVCRKLELLALGNEGSEVVADKLRAWIKDLLLFGWRQEWTYGQFITWEDWLRAHHPKRFSELKSNTYDVWRVKCGQARVQWITWMIDTLKKNIIA